ncbi:MAG: acyltransferase family protein [Merdimonas faecis]|uniref:acyltransferase family protein n=1 Tax=Merdimonas faecis TaxID=1653435 RepID=UPI00399061A9
MKRGGTDARGRLAYITGVDGLRAIAVLMVIAYHLSFSFAKGGLLGVTVFFVISGFVITRILLAELENTGTINLVDFWIRRIRRLIPAILTMVIILILVTAVANRVLFTKACEDIPSVLLGYNNWWQIFRDISYFENAGAPSPLTHCWSLAVETQFYLFYPLILLLLSKFRDRYKKFVYVSGILLIISAALMGILFSPTKDPSRVYYGTDTRMFSFLFGSLIALAEPLDIVRRKAREFAVTREVVGVVSFIALLYMTSAIDGYSSFLYRGGQVIASALTALVIFAVMNKRSILGRGLSLTPLKWLGERSYGLYLWHYPIILLLSGGKRSAWWIVVLELLLTLLCAELSYRFVETPIRHGAISKNIRLIRSHPQTKRERKKQIQSIRKSRRAVIIGGVLSFAALICIAIVPRETVLGNVQELEKQEDRSEQLKSQKTGEQKTSTNEKAKGQTEDEILSNLNLLLIGDSVSMGASDEFYETFPNSISDTAVSRYATESYEIYDSYVKNEGWDGDGVIFALGSNGPLYDSLDTMRSMVAEDKPFFIINIRAPYVSWEASNNEEISKFVDSTDETYLIDWYEASEGHPEYFAEDETHLNVEGAQAYMDCIKNSVIQVYEEKE